MKTSRFSFAFAFLSAAAVAGTVTVAPLATVVYPRVDQTVPAVVAMVMPGQTVKLRDTELLPTVMDLDSVDTQ